MSPGADTEQPELPLVAPSVSAPSGASGGVRVPHARSRQLHLDAPPVPPSSDARDAALRDDGALVETARLEPRDLDPSSDPLALFSEHLERHGAVPRDQPRDLERSLGGPADEPPLPVDDSDEFGLSAFDDLPPRADRVHPELDASAVSSPAPEARPPGADLAPPPAPDAAARAEPSGPQRDGADAPPASGSGDGVGAPSEARPALAPEEIVRVYTWEESPNHNPAAPVTAEAFRAAFEDGDADAAGRAFDGLGSAVLTEPGLPPGLYGPRSDAVRGEGSTYDSEAFRRSPLRRGGRK